MHDAVTAFLIDAVAGTVGGVAGVWVGAPLDIIKTRHQTQAQLSTRPPKHLPSPFSQGPPSILQALRATVREEGFRALFKGSVVASIGQAPNNFLVFGTYGAALEELTKRRRRRRRGANGDGDGDRDAKGGGEPALADLYVAGSAAGFLQSFALAPFEHVKVQQQIFVASSASATSPSSSPSLPSPSPSPTIRECAKDILRARGLRGLFRGLAATMLRDVPTYGIYFVSFELTKRALWTQQSSQRTTTSPASAPAWVVLLGGSVAGVASWGLAAPADVLKSVVQARPIDSPHLSLADAARGVYRTQGWRGFTRGLAPLLIRSIPVNAVTFVGFEKTCALLKGSGAG